MSLPASNSVMVVTTNFGLVILVYSPFTPVSAVKALMMGSTAVMLA